MAGAPRASRSNSWPDPSLRVPACRGADCPGFGFWGGGVLPIFWVVQPSQNSRFLHSQAVHSKLKIRERYRDAKAERTMICQSLGALKGSGAA